MKIALNFGGSYICPETGEEFPPAEYIPSKKSISVKFPKTIK